MSHLIATVVFEMHAFAVGLGFAPWFAPICRSLGAIRFVVVRFGPFSRDPTAQRGLVLSALLVTPRPLLSPERAVPWGST